MTRLVARVRGLWFETEVFPALVIGSLFWVALGVILFIVLGAFKG